MQRVAGENFPQKGSLSKDLQGMKELGMRLSEEQTFQVGETRVHSLQGENVPGVSRGQGGSRCCWNRTGRRELGRRSERQTGTGIGCKTLEAV